MSKKCIRTSIVTLIVTNIITGGLFAGMIIQAGKQKETQPAVQQNIKTEYSYKDNPGYVEKMSLYSVYGKQADMLCWVTPLLHAQTGLNCLTEMTLLIAG